MSDDYELLLNILILVKFILYVFLIIFACIHALPLCLLSRFHTSINIMIVHVCFTFIGSAVFWTIVYMLSFRQVVGFNIITQQRCSILSSIETMFNCLVIYSLCTTSINRFCIINYPNKIIYKSRKWTFICIGITWLISLSVSLPLLIISNTPMCTERLGHTLILQICSVLFIIIILPIVYRSLAILPALSLLGNIIDLFLFNHQLISYFRQLFVRRNNRIQPVTVRYYKT